MSSSEDDKWQITPHSPSPKSDNSIFCLLSYQFGSMASSIMQYVVFIALLLGSLVAGQGIASASVPRNLKLTSSIASYPELPPQYLLTTNPVTVSTSLLNFGIIMVLHASYSMYGFVERRHYTLSKWLAAALFSLCLWFRLHISLASSYGGMRQNFLSSSDRCSASSSRLPLGRKDRE